MRHIALSETGLRDHPVSGPLYFSDPSSLEHDPREFSPGHPDTPERLEVLERALAEQDWFGWERCQAPPATEAELELVHTRAHVVAIRELCEAGGGAIDPDTFVGRPSWVAALHAAGGAREMTRALLEGAGTVGFCGVRPSGHHAESGRAMGFCLFNNVAVAAAAAIAEFGLERVLVIDWDVHHGNGTEEIFALRSDVLFASLHQSPLYPGTGRLEDAGRGPGEGYTINLPVPPGTGEAEWMELFDRVLMPAAAAFEPQLVLVSAGFDAHAADPLAECRLRTETFAIMAERLREFTAAARIPLGVVLEGGYDRAVLAEAVCAILPVLAEEAVAPPALVTPSGTSPLTERAIAQVGRWWPPA
jgi:acetoin utilization deacetylase AcuC-like enzyme